MSDKSKLTKKKLCDTFIDLYIKKDLNKITIQNITDKAGYNRGTFYLYYRDIYDMLEKIEKDLIEKAKANVRTVVTDNGINIEHFFIEVILKFYKENEKYGIPLMVKDNNFVNLIKENLRNIICEKIEFDNYMQKEKLEYLIEYQISAIVGVINLWFKNGKKISLDELTKILYSISNEGVINSFKNVYK